MTADRLFPRLGRFEAALVVTLVILAVALSAVLLRGDRVGVQVTDRGPRAGAPGSVPVVLTFAEPMQQQTVEERLHIDPAQAGTFSWSADGRTVTFTPARAFLPGVVSVRLEAGARAISGRRVQRAIGWSFTVQPPRVVALAPAEAALYQLTVFDPASGPDTGGIPLTAGPYGIEDYAVSPDGRQIAYSQRNAGGTLDLWLLDLLTGQAHPLTRCIEAQCTRPAWKPDGTQIAYERRDFTGGSSDGLTSARAWVVDLLTLDTRLLWEDPAILGQTPTWSPDGRRLAAYDASLPGIRVRDLDSGTEITILTRQDVVGAFSPDGGRLVYPVLVASRNSPQLYTQLEVIDLETGAITSLGSGKVVQWEDGEAVWSPDGTGLVVARQYFDQRHTPGRQLYWVDPASGDAEPLIVDAAYGHSSPRWDAAGQRLLFQRYPVGVWGSETGGQEAVPELWIINRATNELVRAAVNAFSPGWLP